MTTRIRWLPLDFPIPTVEVPGRWKLRTLGTSELLRDFSAIMSSIEHLQSAGVFSAPDSGADWPLPTATLHDAVRALALDELGNLARCWMSFAIVSPDETEEYGCVYVWPSFKQGWDAQMIMWATAARHDELDAELWEWCKTWVRENFPFEWERIACPGREIPWDEWNALDDAMMPVSNVLMFLEGIEIGQHHRD